MLNDRVRDFAFAGAVATVVLFVYTVTLYPDVAGGDSGELVAAVATGGLIHPPGYPLYSLAGRLFLLLPHGTLAWRMNMLSAVCDAAAAAVLCFAVSRRTRCWPSGVATAALFAFAPGVWQYAICAEVFALNNLFVALLVLCAVLFDERRDRRYRFAGALFLGLALADHHTVLFTAVPLALWVLWTGRPGLWARPRTLLPLIGLLALGLLPYAVLPFEQASHSPVSWGVISTWGAFWRHIFRLDYGTFRLVASSTSRHSGTGTLAAWCGDLMVQLGWGGAFVITLIALVPLGRMVAGGSVQRAPFQGLSRRAARLGRGPAAEPSSPPATAPGGTPLEPWRSAPVVTDDRRVVGELGLGGVLCLPPIIAVAVMVALGNIPVSDPLYRAVIARFWQQPDMFIFVACGCALARIERTFAASIDHTTARRGVAAAALATSALAVAPRARSEDHHNNTLVRSYAGEVLRSAPPGALLLTRGDLLSNALRYLQAADSQRPDVRVVDLELLGFGWMRQQLARIHPEIIVPGDRYMPGAEDGFTIRQFLDANIDHAPIWVCGGFRPGDSSADPSYVRSPVSFCEAIRRNAEGATASVGRVDDWLHESETALPRIDFSGQQHPLGSWESVVYHDFVETRRARAAYVLAIAVKAKQPQWKIDQAVIETLQQVIAVHPDRPVSLYTDLEVAMARAGLRTSDDRIRVGTVLRHALDDESPTSFERRSIEEAIMRLDEVGAP